MVEVAGDGCDMLHRAASCSKGAVLPERLPASNLVLDRKVCSHLESNNPWALIPEGREERRGRMAEDGYASTETA
jgi:hypothetical protein